MDRNNWNEQPNLNNLVDSIAMEGNIYITATKTRSLECSSGSYSRFHMLFGVIHRTRSCTNPTSEAQILSTFQFFDHPFDTFASAEQARSVVASMLSDEEIMIAFQRGGSGRQSLHWKEVIITGKRSSAVVAERVQLRCYDDLITKISEAAVRVVCDASASTSASASGSKLVEMAITIDKRTVIPQQEFERLIPHDVQISQILDHEKPKLYSEIIHNRDFTLSDFMFFLGLEKEQRGSTTEIRRTSSKSMSMPVFQSVPATKPVVETLEKIRYERSEDNEDESKSITCVICMEVMMTGSLLTGMPCSHLYHSDCISNWLRRNPVCPICRFKLPTK